MKLSELSKAVNTIKPNHSILIYGQPKTGKTRLVGTAAKIPEIKRIFWIDLENGAETLLHMGLSDEELAKIELIRIVDTREVPRGCETILKMFSSKDDIKICDLHGKVNCVECQDKTTKQFTGTSFNLRKCTHEEDLLLPPSIPARLITYRGDTFCVIYASDKSS